MKFALGGNIDGKGENAGYQHFLLFPQCFFFKRLLMQGHLTLYYTREMYTSTN